MITPALATYWMPVTSAAGIEPKVGLGASGRRGQSAQAAGFDHDLSTRIAPISLVGRGGRGEGSDATRSSGNKVSREPPQASLSAGRGRAVPCVKERSVA